MSSEEQQSKWQPVMLIASHRIECECGALAIFVVLEEAESEEVGKRDMDYTSWCRDCWQKVQEESEIC